MQHLDEGKIHAWLDGALSPEEAARAEAHVAGCAECAAMAAEARGFIAASSRILTALDDAPRGVTPARTVVRSRFGPAWKAAAAVVVVALGTVAIRNTLRVDGSRAEASVTADSALIESSRQSQPATAESNATGVAANTAANQSVPPTVLSEPASPSRTAATKRVAVLPTPTVAQAPAVPASAAPQSKTAATRRADESVMPSAVAQDYASAQPALKVVRVDTTLIERRTVYEVAPNETVTLVEPRTADAAPALTNGGVAGGMKSSVGAAAPSALDARRVMSRSAAPSSAADAPVQAAGGFANTEHTIEWRDASTGRMFRLSGRFPPGRLQEIRTRIERQRQTQKKP
jgi:hypothetical protein